MKIISGSTHLRFNSRVNHACYAHLHDYTYVFDTTPRPLASVYDHKLRAILSLPVDDDWWFWIDDDAFFTQFDRRLEDVQLDFDRGVLIFPKSPVNPQGGWTFLSSGNFFFRNCAEVHDFFLAALTTELSDVRSWWNESELGMFTNGDQDKIVFQLLRNPALFHQTQLAPYEPFNTRPYHFNRSPSEHFLVHFAVPQRPKDEVLREFQEKFGFKDDALIPGEYTSTADLFRQFSTGGDTKAKRWWSGLRWP